MVMREMSRIDYLNLPTWEEEDKREPGRRSPKYSETDKYGFVLGDLGDEHFSVHKVTLID